MGINPTPTLAEHRLLYSKLPSLDFFLSQRRKEVDAASERKYKRM